MQYTFGSGNLYGVPLTDAVGNAIANPTIIKFGTLQECSVEFAFDVKELYGQNQFPVAVGRGKGKVSCKAKFAQIFAQAYASLFFGQSTTMGVEITNYIDTVGSQIPSSSPYTITPTPPNAGTFLEDRGVHDTSGLPMERVASMPAAGQYSFAAGTYTFSSADAGKTVFIDYTYSKASTNAQRLQVTNQPLGYIPTFKAELYAPYLGKSLVLTLPACVATKLSFPTKLDDFTIPEFDFSAFADSTGVVVDLKVSE